MRTNELQSHFHLTLDSSFATGGSNLSVGQRQVVALARAMVRSSKLLILDEATWAIDQQSDSTIQRSLRTRIGKDVSVLIVAHRLATVMDCDRIVSHLIPGS
jgi:ABC-type multidrug transport system fused ATPase/permease subunit